MRCAPVRSLLAAMLVLGLGSSVDAGPTLRLVTATYFGTAEDGDLQGAAAAPDGTIYVVGNTGAPMADLPDGVHPTSFAAAVANPRCGHGFVAHLSGDGRQVLHYAEFARGVVLLTSVQLNDQGVYVGGYASEGLEGLLTERPGLIRQYPLTAELKQYESDLAAGKEDKIAGRPGLGRYGAPCVLRLSPDLAKLEAGTYLEGWQQVWDKKRVAKPGKEMLGGYQEYYWQPTALGLLKGGDLVVCHDGGYFRPWTEKDKELAKGDPKLLDRLTFYDTCDHVSRLSPDLSRRVWTKAIYTPPVKPEVAKEVKNGWPLDHYSSPRTQRMRLDRDDRIYLCGWSASATSNEPWWYAVRLPPRPRDRRNQLADLRVRPHVRRRKPDGRPGGRHRLRHARGRQRREPHHQSAGRRRQQRDGVEPDRRQARHAFRSEGPRLRLRREARPLVGPGTAGGRQDPPGAGPRKVGPWGWTHDVAALPDNGVLAFGRYNGKFDFTDDAWWKESPVDNPIAFVRAYSPDMELKFSTAVPGVVPFEIARVGPSRYLLVGRAEQGAAPATPNAMVPKSPGKTDGYLMIIEYK